MELLSNLLLMLSLGFMGSLHCVGMCGGLVTAVTMSRPTIWRSGLLLYQLGRITTYATLGLLVGISGTALHSFGGNHIQQIVAVIAGSLMITFALNLAGWLPDPLRHITLWVTKRVGLAELARHASQGQRSVNWYRLGIANGALPCGLVYAALALALKSGDAAISTVMMVAFGVGTMPAMVFIPSLLQSMKPIVRNYAVQAAALLIITMGVITIMRSSSAMMMMH
ncbi:MAG: sulfite exporter TauE/SafE family protein [Mariprofundales bacterium]|nr:sulfite exporter TauE/SafE family protein [Mariprofundales bacterium]